MTSFDNAVAAVERPLSAIHTSGSFWNKEEPGMANGIVVRGGMWEPQRQWWQLKNFIKVLVGGYGAGKTNALSKRMIALALTNAPCPVAVISPTFPIARQTTIATIAQLLEGKRSLLGRRLAWSWNGSSHEFTIKYNGRTAHILIYSGERPLSLRGPNLAAAGIDEPFIQEEEVFHQMIARVRHPLAVHREIACTGTPEQLNWGYDLCVGDAKEKHDVGFIQASTRSNRALDSMYVSRLEGAFSAKAADAYIEGQFRNLAEGMVYYSFDPAIHVDETGDLDKIPDGAEVGIGMDFNVNPFAFVAFWRAGSHMHFFEEFELPNADTEYACSVIKDRPWANRVGAIYPDATGSARKTAAPGGKSDYWYIEAAGLTIDAPAANPKRKDRYNAVNGKFKPAAKGSKPTLTLSKHCKKLKKYLSVHSHELLNKQVHMTHLLDAFGYPIHRLFPVDKDAFGVHKLTGA